MGLIRLPGSATVLARIRAGRPGESRREHADVAQLVAHHLAKVRVAGSNPVVRSVRPFTPGRPRDRVFSEFVRGDDLRPSVMGIPPVQGAAEWPSGLGKGLQSPVRGFDSRLRLGRLAQWESATLTR